MAIPTFDQFIEPLFRVLEKSQDGMRSAEVYEAVSALVGLTDEDKSEMLPSGAMPRYKNRIGWAQQYLCWHGSSDKPRRGVWRLTDAGRRFIASHPSGISAQDVEALVQQANKAGYSAEKPEPPVGDASPLHLHTPDERIADAIREINEKAATEILAHIAQQTPEFFERLVLDLLGALGYGKGPEERARVGRSGDGGIDGIISLDKLGLDKVYVQAKRWQGTVGRPVVQGFFGALAEHRATRGVMITTSGYSREAVDYARGVGSLVLIDGNRLAALMIEAGVGVEKTALYTSRVNSDYFADE